MKPRRDLFVVVLVPALTFSISPGLRAEPERWDARLDALGVHLEPADVAAGAMYWRLLVAEYQDENESGGTHHIYIRALSESGEPIQGQRIRQLWPTGNPTGSALGETKGPGIDDWWGNMPMAGGWCPFWPEGPHGPYGAQVDGVSDTVWGMGMPCNRHVNYRLTFQWTRKTGGGGGDPGGGDPGGDPVAGNLIENGDFANGLDSWRTWTERGAFTPTPSDGRVHIAADNVNGGIWQSFETGGAGTTIPITGFWASSPTAPNNQWAEVLVINGPRTPRDGQDIRASDSDVVLVYKNDTWATPGGWSGAMRENAPVASAGEFVAAADTATIVLKFGNTGGATTGAIFDDIVVSGPSSQAFRRGDSNVDGRVDIADAVKTLIVLFSDGAALECELAADANEDDAIDVSDALRTLAALFSNGPPLARECVGEAAPGGLGCEAYEGCE